MNKEKIKSVLTIANGKPPKKRLLNRLVKQSDCIIAADGGANTCYKYSINPDYIIGDLDSVDEKSKQHFKDSEFIYRPGQNEHDLLKALKFCESLKPKKVVVTAVFGKRIDHTFSNLFTLQNQNLNFELEFIDDYAKIFIINNQFEFNLPKNQPISFLSYKPVYGITLKRFKYNLTNKDFPAGFNGVSNEIKKSPATVEIKEGSVIAIVAHG
jgi:thiamine pyrophosphokinase